MLMCVLTCVVVIVSVSDITVGGVCCVYCSAVVYGDVVVYTGVGVYVGWGGGVVCVVDVV